MGGVSLNDKEPFIQLQALMVSALFGVELKACLSRLFFWFIVWYIIFPAFVEGKSILPQNPKNLELLGTYCVSLCYYINTVYPRTRQKYTDVILLI